MSAKSWAIPLLVLATTLGLTGATSDEQEDLLKQAVAFRQDYNRYFRDLTAVETWVMEVLRRDGTVGERRTVVSDLFVYQSRFDSGVRREYRITRDVDGKAAGDPVQQAMKLFRGLAGARTRAQEDAALERQNFRHVLRFVVWGLTIDPLWAFQEERRKDLLFSPTGRERLDGEEVVGLRYERPAFQPEESTIIYKRFKHPRKSVRGVVWLDSRDGRLRRLVHDIVVVDDDIRTAAVLLRTDTEYRASPVGVVPSRTEIALFDKDTDKKSPPVLRLAIRQTVAYEAFKRFDVSTSTDVKTPGQNKD